MSHGEQVQGQQAVSHEEGRIELDRLLHDPRFHGTERAKAILSYLAEKRFQGCDKAVKAYAIALDVLGRGSNFDSASDPIVRIEMSRLRSCLSQYYEAFGEEHGVSIDLPIGRYIAMFSRIGATDASPVVSDSAETLARPPDGPTTMPIGERSGRLPSVYVAGLAALIALGSASAGAVWYVKHETITVRPSVTLSMSSPQDVNAGEAAATSDYLVTALSRFRTLNISSQRAMSTASTSRRTTPAKGGSYDIDMKYYADNDDRTVWWQIVDNHGGGILKSGLERVEAGGRDDAVVRGDLVSMLAKRFASTRVVINLLELRDGTAASVLGNSCVLKAEYELDEGGKLGIQSALPCLERTVAIQPADPDALALLSRILVAAEGGNPATTPFDRALALANRAASLDPTSDRAQVAIMTAQFYHGSTDAAIAAGNQALALNPDNPDVLAKLSGVLFSSGYRDAAVSLAQDAGKDVDAMPRDARIVLALDAYGRGDFADASLVSEQINCSDMVVRAIRAAALGQMGSPGSKASLDDLAAILPDYRASLGQSMGWRRYPAPLIASLQQGLAKAEAVKSPTSNELATVN